jgi:putative membrane protein
MFLRAHLPYLAAVGILCGVALAQNPPTGPPSTTPGSPGSNSPSYPGAGPMGPEQPASEPVFSDKDFVKKAAEEKLTEVELGKLAQEKGSSPAVKEFGKRIVEDHSKNDQNLASAASKVNVDVPTELPRGGKKTVEKLSKLSGPDFDRAYAKLMLNDQKNNVESFSEEARLGKIPEVKNFAAKTLPTLQEHRQMADQLETSVKK